MPSSIPSPFAFLRGAVASIKIWKTLPRLVTFEAFGENKIVERERLGSDFVYKQVCGGVIGA